MIKHLLTAFFLIQTLTMIAQQQTIKSHQWQHRLLLVFAPSALDAQLNAQLDLFHKDEIGLEDRDLLIYTIFEKSGIAFDGKPLSAQMVQSLRAEYEIGKENFVVILIGKDGGEKWRKTELVQLEALYDVIDVMPMRRQEIQNQKKKGRHQN